MNHWTENSKSPLVAVDYSELSSVALQRALALSTIDDVSALHVTHVAKGSEARATDCEVQKNELHEWLANSLERLGNCPMGLDIRAHLVHGHPAESIVQVASDLRIDTVIVGTHGRTGVERFVVGSVAEQVVRNCGCPVLVMRQKEHRNSIPLIEATCCQCLEAREVSGGVNQWCEQHEERHGRRHTYYSQRHSSWVTTRLSL